MKNTILIIIAFLLGGAIAYMTLGSNVLGAPNTGIFYSATNSKAAVTATWSTVLQGNSGRVYGAIVNDGANTVYLNLGPTTSTAGYGIRLNANGGSFEINQSNLYLGAITAVTVSGTSTLSIVEK